MSAPAPPVDPPRGGLRLLDLHLRLSAAPRSLDATRAVCAGCGARRSLLCHDCGAPLCAPLTSSRAALPLAVHVWRERGEDRAASTAAQVVAAAAPGRAAIFDLDALPAYADPGGVLVLFPCADAVRAAALPGDLGRFHTLAVVDCTWHKSGRALLALRGLPAGFVFVHLAAYETLFWRHQALGAHCLSTVEAVYFCLREFVVEAARRRRRADAAAAAGAAADAVALTPRAAAEAACDLHNEIYDGAFDDLCLVFLYKYFRIQDEYERSGTAYTGKMRPGYIVAHQQPPRGSEKRTHGEAFGGAGTEAAAAAADAGGPARRPKGAWAVRTDVLDAATAKLVANDASRAPANVPPPAATGGSTAAGAALLPQARC